MKKTEKLVSIILALSIIAFMMTLFEFAATQDIYHEYIGTTILDMLDKTTAENLPGGTSTYGEWFFLRISWLYKVLFFIFLIVVLIKLLNKMEPEKQ